MPFLMARDRLAAALKLSPEAAADLILVRVRAGAMQAIVTPTKNYRPILERPKVRSDDDWLVPASLKWRSVARSEEHPDGKQVSQSCIVWSDLRHCMIAMPQVAPSPGRPPTKGEDWRLAEDVEALVREGVKQRAAVGQVARGLMERLGMATEKAARGRVNAALRELRSNAR